MPSCGAELAMYQVSSCVGDTNNEGPGRNEQPNIFFTNIIELATVTRTQMSAMANERNEMAKRCGLYSTPLGT